MIPHDFIKRAEGFVHQQDVRIKRKCTRDGGTLLHAARELPREFLLESTQFDQLQNTLHTLRLVGFIVPHNFERQANVAANRAPRIQPSRLEHIAICPRAPRLFRADAIHFNAASSGLLQIRHNAQKRGFTAARGANEADKIAFLNIERHVLERMHRAVIGLKGQTKVFSADDCVVAQVLDLALKFPPECS